MDQEELIENVKAYEPLYVISHPKYSDTEFRANIWKEIAKEMNQPMAVCKKTWTNLRDSFRRALKKKRETRSGQAASKIKKWRFEDEMSFLVPFMQERDTCSSLEDISDDDNEGEPNEHEYDDKNDDKRNDQDDNRKDDQHNNRGYNRNDNEDDEKDDDLDKKLNIEDEGKKKEKKVNRKSINLARNKRKGFQPQSETATAVTMKRLLGKKSAKEQTPPNQQPDAIDTFFASIASTVKNFSPYYQNIAKSQIFSIVSDLEMKQIMQDQPLLPPNT